MAEPDITGGGAPVNNTGKARTGTAARMGAKVTVDGIEKLNSKFKDFLQTLKSVRTELGAINNGGSAAGGNESTSKLGNMISGFKGIGGSQQFKGGAILALSGMSTVNERTKRNMVESTGISANDTLTSSMYSFNYGTAERDRYSAAGKFGGSRQEVLAASNLGFRYGQTFQTNMNFLGSMGNVVQASGGTMNMSQAAESAGDFLDPVVQYRAAALGIPLGRQRGEVQNPNETAMGYLKHYENRRGGRMNEADFANLASAGSRERAMIRRFYGLDNSAIDQMQQAGMQSMQYRNKFGGELDFNDSEQLDRMGLNNQKLGLRSTQLSTVVGRRESNFFAQQEGAMVDRIGQEITIQETLGKVEDKFSDVIGVLFQFENAVTAITAVLGTAAMLGVGKAATGALGTAGGVGLSAAGLGPSTGAGGAVAMNRGSGRDLYGRGANAGGGGGGAPMAGGGMSKGARAATGAVGAALVFGGVAQSATATSNMGALSGVAGAAAGGAMIGSFGGPVGTAVGASLGAAAGMGGVIYANAKASDNEDIQTGGMAASSMDDKELIQSLKNYTDSRAGFAKGRGAGPKERGRFDVFMGRRSALISSAVAEAQEAGILDGDSEFVGELAHFLAKAGSPEAMKKDALWASGATGKPGPLAEKWQVYKEMMKSSKEGRDIYEKYFGKVSDPLSYEPITTDQYESLVMTSQQVIDSVQNAYIPGGGSGDPVSGGGGGKGDGNPWTMAGGAKDGRGPGHPSWDKLDGRMKMRLAALLKASGGKVWVGEGWRDPATSEPEFLRRHYEDPNGTREYKGKRYSLKSGMSPMAPPGKSNHNIGLAADLVGDMPWLQQNAGKFGLKTFANVPGVMEDWHVQLEELANGFLGNGESQGTGNLDSNAGKSPEPVPEGSPGGAGGFVMGGGATTGVNYSVSSIIAGMGGSSGGGGGSFSGTGGSTTAGNMGEQWDGTVPVGAEEAARYAHAAGFRGTDLVKAVAISGRESGWSNVKSNKSDDWGLWQINGVHTEWLLERGIISEKSDLLNPQVNAHAAYALYESEGFNPWRASDDSSLQVVQDATGGPGFDPGGDPLWNTDVQQAAAAVSSAGVGGDPLDRGSSEPSLTSGSGGITINMGGVTIQSSGDAHYDADAFLRAVSPKLQEAAGMMVKRTSG